MLLLRPRDKAQQNYDYQLVKNEWSLEDEGLDNSDTVLIEGLSGTTRSCQEAECVLANIAIFTAGVITVSAGSLIVSGSVVVVGDTVNWLK